MTGDYRLAAGQDGAITLQCFYQAGPSSNPHWQRDVGYWPHLDAVERVAAEHESEAHPPIPRAWGMHQDTGVEFDLEPVSCDGNGIWSYRVPADREGLVRLTLPAQSAGGKSTPQAGFTMHVNGRRSADRSASPYIDAMGARLYL